MSRTLAPAALAAALLASPEAVACGGFFCNTAQPVVQDAERIAFGIDEAAGVVEAHVQIFYQGPSDQFAWVVPVPTNPEVFLSSDVLFDTLSVQLAPIFQLNLVEEGRCRSGGIRLFSPTVEMALDAAAGGTGGATGAVDVVQQGQVGPYDMVVLQGSDTAELLGWLTDNDYDLPPGIEPLLAPYVADGAYFLALKLAKDRDTGDIAPIGFTYEGTKPAVPIQLTSIAAAPDMRLETYVFASERAVPESYLHVRINEAAIDWWSGGQNYADVITLAADEAGGHAFATDYAGSPDALRGTVYDPAIHDVDALRSSATFARFTERMQAAGWRPSAQLQNALLACVDAPAGVDPTDFLNCPDCYDWDQSSFDADACADLLDAAVVEPLMRAEALFDHPWVSRLTSSLDAVEMTVDPVFTTNPDMGEVSNRHQADFVYDCTGGKRRDRALRRLDLQDGRQILIPSERWCERNDTTPFEFIRDLGDINAAIIEKTGASGQPDVITDWTDELFDQTDAHNRLVMQLMGCGGCATGGPATGGMWLAALGLLAARRRG